MVQRGDRRPVRSVLMTAIPAELAQASAGPADLSYVAYGQATWQWWCQRNGVRFVLLDRPVDEAALAGVSPLVHRWRAAQRLLAEGPAHSQVAVVDADTMIRWDAPDFFALAGGSLAAVPDTAPDWVYRSIRAYQRFFPEVRLDWWEYFNAGLVVVSPEQVPVLAAFIDFYQRHQAELAEVQRQDGGIDQTLLNFFVRQRGEPVRFLPLPFNLTNCMPASLYLLPKRSAAGAGEQQQRLLNGILAAPGTFDFIDHSYIWHFNAHKSTRAEFMRRAWHSIRANYPGAPALD
jgi:hypothetical protein